MKYIVVKKKSFSLQSIHWLRTPPPPRLELITNCHTSFPHTLHRHRHVSVNRRGRRDIRMTSQAVSSIFLRSPLALWDLTNPRPVQSLMLSPSPPPSFSVCLVFTLAHFSGLYFRASGHLHSNKTNLRFYRYTQIFRKWPPRKQNHSAKGFSHFVSQTQNTVWTHFLLSSIIANPRLLSKQQQQQHNNKQTNQKLYVTFQGLL